MSKRNCWEVKKCGREPGGALADELGICSAAIEERANGMNGGKNAGRACWAVTGTQCSENGCAGFAAKLWNCLKCDFYKSVLEEEKELFMSSKDIMRCVQGKDVEIKVKLD